MILNRCHPLSLLCFYLLIAVIPAFSDNPVLHLTSLIAGTISIFTWKEPRLIRKSIPGYMLFFILISVINPLIYHDGNTVLFYLNSKRITLEALAYGIDSALLIISIILWFESFSHYLSSEKIMFIFGRISPKLATIITMVLRFVPYYSNYIKAYRKQQKLLGLYGEGSFIENIRAEAKIFAGFLSWSLEHSMTTASSMACRGYGVKRRTQYSIYKFRTIDTAICILSISISAYLVYIISNRISYVTYYPTLDITHVYEHLYQSLVALFLFTLLALIPLILKLFEKKD